MSAYVFAEFTIDDKEAYLEYRERAREAIGRFDGKMLVRNTEPSVLEGDWREGGRVVLIEFEDAASARAWYESPGYEEALPFAEKSMSRRMAIVESP